MYDQSEETIGDALVGFSGPGGSSEGLRRAGFLTAGIEQDEDACSTAVKMGLQSIQSDITLLDPHLFYETYISTPRSPQRPFLTQFSPPCPGFSKAGKGLGRLDLPLIQDAMADLANMSQDEAEEAALMWRQLLETECKDPRSALTFEPIRWVAALAPDYVMLEQVPEVIVVWEVFADVLRAWGYNVWCGKVFAEQYGVPQTRIRAFLMASKVGPVYPPVATHSKYHNRTPKKLDEGVEKWVSMAEALGWGMLARPYPTIMAGTKSGGADPMMIGGSGARKIINDAARGADWEPWKDTDIVGFPRKYDGGSGGAIEIDGEQYRARDFRSGDEPAFSLTEKSRSWVRYPGDEPIGDPPWSDTDKIGFPRRGDDLGPTTEIDGIEYRERDLRDGDQPSFAVTEKARSWVRFPGGEDEPPIAQIAAGRTGGGTPRDIDAPSPSITGKGTAMWIWDGETYRGPNGERVTHMGDVSTQRGTIRQVTEPAANTSQEKAERAYRRAVADEVEHGVLDDGQPRLNNQSGTEFDYAWPADRPSPVIAGRGLVTMPGANANRFNGATKSRNDGIRVTVQEAAVLQSFPPDWSFQGTKTSQYQQVGNAVPPLLQYALTRQLLGD